MPKPTTFRAPRTWRSANGTTYAIKDMETSHLINCARFLRRKAVELVYKRNLENLDNDWMADVLLSYNRFLTIFGKTLEKRQEVKSEKVRIDWCLFKEMNPILPKVKWKVVAYQPRIKEKKHEKVVIVVCDPDWSF